jgi:hypothetical protein
MNWFFLEAAWSFGDQVDAWFCAIGQPEMEQALANEVKLGHYRVDRVCSPMRLADGSNPSPLASIEQFDSWALPATRARLARHFMSRPGLPTTGFQALAFALTVGFDEIYLSGIDLYQPSGERYAHAIPDWVKAALQPKDLEPTYEQAHSRDSDLAFLATCRAEFPNARIYTVSQAPELAQVLPQPPGRTDGGMAAGPIKRLAAPKEPPQEGLAPAVGTPFRALDGPVDAQPFALIDGRKCAFVTMVSSEPYIHGALALANSLAKVGRVPLIALVTEGVDASRLVQAGVFTAKVDVIGNPHLSKGRRVQPRFATVFTKLHVWRLAFLDRMVYLDADTLVLKNIDQLFAMDGFAAARDWGLRLEPGFNSGVFVTAPSASVFEAMVVALDSLDSADGGDQGFLNSFFPEWTPLEPGLNVLTRLMFKHPDLWRPEETAVIHYVGHKPWEFWDQIGPFDELDRLWLSFLTSGQLADLVQDLRSRGAGVEGDHARAATLLAASKRAAHLGRFSRARGLRHAAHALWDGVDQHRRPPRWDRQPFRWVPGPVLWLARQVKRGLGRAAP